MSIPVSLVFNFYVGDASCSLLEQFFCVSLKFEKVK